VGRVSNRFENFNLIPEWYHDRVAVQRWTRVWGVALGVAVPMAVTSVVLVQWLAVSPADRFGDQVRAMEAHLGERRSAAEVVPVVIRPVSSGDPRETRPDEWADLLRLLATMSGGEIGFEEVEVRVAENHAVELSIAGLAEDPQSVLRFAATVEQSGLFAPMNSPSITFDSATGSVRFDLSASIVAVAEAGEGSE